MTRRALALVLLLAAGCGGDPVSFTPDAAPDVPPDASPDTSTDTSTDIATDIATDTRRDAPPDLATDAPDAAPPDVPADAAMDARADAAPDAPLDVVVPDVLGARCMSASECPVGWACDIPTCEREMGRCRPIGPCPAEEDLECGCDGRTWRNGCERIATSVGFAHRGPCGMPPDTGVDAGGACARTEDCVAAGYVCDVRTCGGLGSCVPTPPSCAGAPPAEVCGCDGRTFPSDCARLLAAAARRHAGPCAPSDGGTTCPPAVPPCCHGASDCRGPVVQSCVGATAGCGMGVCKPPPAPGQCWSDADCADGRSCLGARVCPCGGTCPAVDEPGLCR